MNREDALFTLNLGDATDREAIEAAYARQAAELDSRIEAAPTASLRAKYEAARAEVDAARTALLDPSPAEPLHAPSLSSTQIRDLPGAAPRYTEAPSGAGAGAAAPGAQIAVEPGRVLAGRYEVRRRIGAGGMGAVYAAHDRVRDKEIAIKVLLPSLLENEAARERFLNEARIASELSHPNIVNVFDVHEEEGLHFLTMELLEGQTLREAIALRKQTERPFPIEEVARIGVALCEGLAHAHEHTVHRDVKPENIFLGDEGSVKLMDFGVARLLRTSQMTSTGMALGTAYYMAPEQLEGSADVDGRADQYAVAVVLYEMLTGRVPTGRAASAREARPEVPTGLSRALDQALSSDAAARYPTMEAFANGLASKGRGLPPAGPVLKIAVAGLAIIALLAGAVWIFAPQASGWLEDYQRRDEYRAEALKLQGEVESLLDRLDLNRRDLDSQVRSAREEPEKSFRRAVQEAVDRAVYSSSRFDSMKGEVQLGEAELERESYKSARSSFAAAKEGLQMLYRAASAGEDFVRSRERLEGVKNRWGEFQSRAAASALALASAAEEPEQRGRERSLAGDLNSAVQNNSQAGEGYEAAIHDEQVRREAEAKRRRDEDERRRVAEGKARREAERQRLASLGLVAVPAGEFWYGCNERVDSDCDDNEKPGRKVTLDAYAIDRTEVTVDAYAACVEAGACSSLRTGEFCNWGASSKGSHPINCVDWNQSKAYCEWKGKRLPSEEEWEKAARGTDGRKHPWGNESVTCSRAATLGCSSGTAAVASKSSGASPYGAMDMVGNVSEWTSSLYSSSSSLRVIRGGGWLSDARLARASARGFYNPRNSLGLIGFRCAQ